MSSTPIFSDLPEEEQLKLLAEFINAKAEYEIAWKNYYELKKKLGMV